MSHKVGDTSDTEMNHSVALPCELCPVNAMVERQCRKSKSKATSNPVYILPLGYAYMDLPNCGELCA